MRIPPEESLYYYFSGLVEFFYYFSGLFFLLMFCIILKNSEVNITTALSVRFEPVLPTELISRRFVREN